MKLAWLFLALILLFSCSERSKVSDQRISGLDTIVLISALDGAEQPVIVRKATTNSERPLVVGLHTWSTGYSSVEPGLLELIEEKDWNFIHPHFRGANDHPKACCNEYVIDDIDASIQWALDSLNVSADSIFVLGASGGGYATLCMFLRSKQRINSFASYVPISDLVSWYDHCDSSGLVYADEIHACTGSSSLFDIEKAKARSPLHWIPDSLTIFSKLTIYTGINDGHRGPVPIDQSIDFYNELIASLGATDSFRFVSSEEKQRLMKRIPLESIPIWSVGDHQVIFEKRYEGIRIIIFDGGHEMIMPGLLDRL